MDVFVQLEQVYIASYHVYPVALFVYLITQAFYVGLTS